MVVIIKGTFGYFNGKKIKPITAADGPQTFDPELEARLVKNGVARYAEENKTLTSAPQPPKGKDDAELPAYDATMKMAELKEIAKAYGVDASKCTSKAEICDLIDASLAEDDDEPDLSPADPV